MESIPDLESYSGPWVGFWTQGQRKGHMELSLRFEGGRVSGSGADLLGPFAISVGDYDNAGSVRFVKVYARYPVSYVGIWDGQMISGTWRLRNQQTGPFEIWPERGGTSLKQLFEAQEQPA